MSEKNHEKSETLEKIKTWLIVFLIVFGILTYGIITFLSIGDKGPPSWRYGAIKDVPGESPFSKDYVK
jgi:hypothetical protein